MEYQSQYRMNKNISAAILAGGGGKRFDGINKSKIIIDGKTIISRIIETFDEIFDEIIIVSNTPAEFKEFAGCNIIGDQFLNKGPLAGIHSALKNTDSEALFIVAGDMPFLKKELIDKQIYCFNNSDCDILIPQNDDFIEPLHGIYRKSIGLMLEKFLEEGKNYAIHEFLKMVNVQYLDFGGVVESKRALTNINSPSDILMVKKHSGPPPFFFN
jgi:molybdopterin-guanine dinucleotide biosynthesis protein A